MYLVWFGLVLLCESSCTYWFGLLVCLCGWCVCVWIGSCFLMQLFGGSCVYSGLTTWVWSGLYDVSSLVCSWLLGFFGL